MPDATPQQARIVYLSHGGGPLPLLGDAAHAAMIAFMQRLPAQLPRPDAILVISAHWEEDVVTLQDGATPELLYDYYGFPPESYQIRYPAPGAPALAARVAAALQAQGVHYRTNSTRGFDHGVFVPLKLMYPQADIPVMQMSLLHSLDAEQHLALGRTLQALRHENLLVVGSGFSFHNLRAYTWGAEHTPDALNNAFQDWLIQTCQDTDTARREAALVAWVEAPGARYCHPRSEHLLPLHVCAGMAQTPARVIFDDAVLGKRCVAFAWE